MLSIWFTCVNTQCIPKIVRDSQIYRPVFTVQAYAGADISFLATVLSANTGSNMFKSKAMYRIFIHATMFISHPLYFQRAAF